MYRNILVPIDGSETAKRGLNEAVSLAKQLGSQIRVMHVINRAELLSPDLVGSAYLLIPQKMHEYATAMLQEAEETVRGAGVDVDTRLFEGNGVSAGEQILNTAAGWPADLIVCGTHGRRGIRRLLMGSDAEYVVRQSPVPVLLVRARESSPGESSS